MDSNDGIVDLLDVDVTLPASGDGPFPTIVMLHGYGGDKTDYEQTKPEGDKQPSEAPDSATLYHWNNVHFAERGYAVVNYTARGFGNSCGMESERIPCTAKRGWIRLADQRFEARDTQHLLGLLVDEGVSDPGALGVTGISYGGGQSIELAYLRNRVRNPDDTFSPWTSPGGKSLSIAAAFPRWPWSDLVDALLPNGRFLDSRVSAENESREPLGVSLQSFTAGLFASGEATGLYAPLGLDPDADLVRWNARVQAGEPPDAEARAIADEIYAHHQGYSLRGLEGAPAPMLLQSGWTDDLFPPKQALRVYNQLRAVSPGAPVSLQFGDLGHQRGANKVNADKAFNDQGTAFFDARLRGQDSGPPAAGSVTAYTQTCPQGAPAGGPFTAASWEQIHPGAVRFGSGAAQTFNSAGSNPATAAGVDPIGGGGGDACRDFSGETDPNTAVYEMPSQGFTLLGLPAVTATVDTTGPFGEIASRLWDVRPDGRKVLVSRGLYRLEDNQKGRVTFQLFGNGYRFEAGHRVRLELLGRDSPTFRASNGTFSVKVSDLQVNLPVREQPGTTSQVVTPVAVGATGRRKPKLSAKLRMSRKRVLSTRGRLILPQGIARANGCRGRITVQVKAGRRTISTRRAFVRRTSCTFASKVRFRTAKRFRGAKRLRVTVRYGGNAVLTPVNLKSRRVKVRRR